MSSWHESRRFMVAGGSGFLGQAVVRQLNKHQAGSIFVPRSRDFDLRELRACEQALDAARPDIVIHAAGRIGGIGANQRLPGTFFRDNALMGIHLIEACRRRGIEKLVTIGTICSYPRLAPVPFREETLWDGYPDPTTGPYGLAKKMLLVQQQAYREEFGFNSIYVMPTNLYGPADNFDPADSHVIAALTRRFVEAAEQNAPHVEVWGSGEASREFLYADDAGEGIVLAAQHYDGPEPVNLGSGVEMPIRELAAAIAEVVGYQGEIVWDRSKPDGQPRRMLDTSRAEREFGFRARTPLRDGLLATIEWFRAHRREFVNAPFWQSIADLSSCNSEIGSCA